ncbi:MFS transporter [Kitasatospora sp. NPDC094011]|uniref:MFS transporter n=1 Tax=Kitasatospora sp. NPDC094011 TaxID=3364090 RepID=UPI0037F6260E
MSESSAPAATPAGGSQRPAPLVLVAIVVAMLLASIDNLIMGTALPTIVSELGDASHFSWVTSGYILATAASTPIWGKVGDMYSRKWAFLISIAVFLAGSVLCGLAPSMGALIAFRVLQGIGGGGLMVGALSLIGVLVAPRERGKFQAMASMVMGAAMVAGPLAGGFLSDHLGWRWCFYVNVPFGVLAIGALMVALHLPANPRPGASLDYLGAAVLAAAVVLLALVTTWGGTQYAWGSPVIIGMLVAAALAVALLLVIERRVPEPILPLWIFKRANFSGAVLLAFFVGVVMIVCLTFLPVYQQAVQGASASNAGLLMLPLLLSMVGINTFTGAVISRGGQFTFYSVLGAGLLAAGVLLLATMDVGTSRIATGAYMVLIGVGLGLLMQITIGVAMESVELKDLGAASSTVTLSRSIGGSLGLSVAGILFSRSGDGTGLDIKKANGLDEAAREAFRRSIDHGTHQVFVYVSAMALVGFLVSWFIRARAQAPSGAAVPEQTPAEEAAEAH